MNERLIQKGSNGVVCASFAQTTPPSVFLEIAEIVVVVGTNDVIQQEKKAIRRANNDAITK